MSVSRNPRVLTIAGWVVAVIPAGMLTMSGVMKLMRPPEVMEGFEKFGFRESVILPLAIVELSCVAVYLFPRTAVLGAILVTGYLGGATVTHVRAGDPAFTVAVPVALGMAAWLALVLRDGRVRGVVPWRK